MVAVLRKGDLKIRGRFVVNGLDERRCDWSRQMLTVCRRTL